MSSPFAADPNYATDDTQSPSGLTNSMVQLDPLGQKRKRTGINVYGDQVGQFGSDVNGFSGQGGFASPSPSSSYPQAQPQQPQQQPQSQYPQYSQYDDTQINPGGGGGGGGGGAGANRLPLATGMPQDPAYANLQNALQSKSLHPTTSSGRLLLGGLVGRFMGGALTPLGDVVAYGAQGAAAHREALHNVETATAQWNASLANRKEANTEAWNATTAETNRLWRLGTLQARDDANAERFYTQNQQTAQRFEAQHPYGQEIQTLDVSPSTYYVNPPTIPPRPGGSGIVDPTDPALNPSGADVAQSLPTRQTSLGMSTPLIPQGYRTIQPPPTPQYTRQGGVQMIPQRPQMEPPPDVQAQMKSQAQQENWIPLSDDAATKIGMPKGSKVPPQVFDKFLGMLQAGQTQSANEQLRRDMAEYARGTATIVAGMRQGQTEDSRADRSYQFNASQLSKLSTPIDTITSRMSRLNDTLAQNNMQSDALVAPELLSVMSGGQGSGLRMNEAEISRIVGGRTVWEGLKAAVNKWSLDPKTATSITPEQRTQIRSLTKAVNDKLLAKQAVLQSAHQSLVNESDPVRHRQIVADAMKKLNDIDNGNMATATATQGTASSASSAPLVQQNKTTKQYRYSIDGGKTWQPGQPPSQPPSQSNQPNQ